MHVHPHTHTHTQNSWSNPFAKYRAAHWHTTYRNLDVVS